jgi:tRNA pseudouridine38-40 synthase
MRRFSWFVPFALDVPLMNIGAQELMGSKNFKSFSRTDTEVKNYICTVSAAEWAEKNNLLCFTIKADRFLYGMVRALVGTLVEIGKGKRGLADLQNILKAEDRQLAGQAAPARGLILEKIYY